MKRTGFFGDLISWEDGVYGTVQVGFPRRCGSERSGWSRSAAGVGVTYTPTRAMSRRLLKFSGGSVDDYATFSTATASPSC